jgi:hypothetical protein
MNRAALNLRLNRFYCLLKRTSVCVRYDEAGSGTGSMLGSDGQHGLCAMHDDNQDTLQS